MLQVLFLVHNKIKHISVDAFKKLSMLKYIHINKIKNISPETFTDSPVDFTPMKI